MSHTKILILFLLCTTMFVAQSKQDTVSHDKATPQVNISIPDTLQIKNVMNKQEVLSWWDKYTASIAVVIAGLLSIGANIWNSHQLKKSNEKNIIAQQNTAKDIAWTQFKAATVAKNRQEWINDLRHTLSEFLTYSMDLFISRFSNVEGSKGYRNFEKLYYSK